MMMHSFVQAYSRPEASSSRPGQTLFAETSQVRADSEPVLVVSPQPNHPPPLSCTKTPNSPQVSFLDCSSTSCSSLIRGYASCESMPSSENCSGSESSSE